MQTQFRFVQQDYVGQHLRSQIEQRHQSEEPQRTVGREVGSKGLVRSLGFPPQQHFSVALLDLKTVEDRQDPADVLPYQLKSLEVFQLQPVQQGRQVAALRIKIIVILRITFLFEVRCVGGVVKLIDGAIAEQVHNYPGCGGVDIIRFAGLRGQDNLGFLMPTFQILPRRFRRISIAVESETLFAEEEAVGMRM